MRICSARRGLAELKECKLLQPRPVCYGSYRAVRKLLKYMNVKTFDEKIDNFIKSLEKPTGTKITRHIDLLVRFGSQLCMPYSKSLGSNLFELRIRGQQEIRIFYTFNNRIAILLHGFIKKTQKTPKREIEIALVKLNTLTNA